MTIANQTFQRHSAGRWIQATGGYQTFIPNPLPPTIPWTPHLAIALSEADRAIGYLSGLGQILPNPDLLIRLLQRQEAVSSSRIEGIQGSLSDLYAYEGSQPTLKPLADGVQEVYNYVRTLEYGLQQLGLRASVTLSLTQEIHRQLMANLREKWYRPGEFRATQNWIGTSGCRIEAATFVPPPPEQLMDVLKAWEQFLQDPAPIPPLIKLALSHYQFEAMHPFLDGNGRVGRLLLALLPIAWGMVSRPLFYLSPRLEQCQQTYEEAWLGVSRQGDWEGWLLFFLRGVTIRSRVTVDQGLRLLNLYTKYREGYAASNKLQALVTLMFENPLISGARVVKELDVSSATAYQYLSLMEKDGILKEVTGRKRGRYYTAHEIIRISEEPAPEDAHSQLTSTTIGA